MNEAEEGRDRGLATDHFIVVGPLRIRPRDTLNAYTRINVDARFAPEVFVLSVQCCGYFIRRTFAVREAIASSRT